mmetsp:Transcript_24053/g.36073  ORF Transcript_24053/g.36073 Transcript_24053/m.36073 type:complete len:112 (+) Transcript_24053:1-336(+)
MPTSIPSPNPYNNLPFNNPPDVLPPLDISRGPLGFFNFRGHFNIGNTTWSRARAGRLARRYLSLAAATKAKDASYERPGSYSGSLIEMVAHAGKRITQTFSEWWANRRRNG